MPCTSLKIRKETQSKFEQLLVDSAISTRKLSLHPRETVSDLSGMRYRHRRLAKRCITHLLVVSAVALLLLLFVANLPEISTEQQQKIPVGQRIKLKSRHPPVVKIIHQSWKTSSLPPLFAKWSASFKRCLPNFRRILWTDSDNRKLVAQHYPWFLARYDSLAPGVQRADAARLFYMHKFGGVYCDLDCDCLRGFENLLVNTSLALGAMEGSLIRGKDEAAFVAEGQVENSFMYSQPGHPFFWDLILKLNATQGELAIMTSGTYLLMSGIRAARQAGLVGTQFKGLPYLTVYPPLLFNPFSWISQVSNPAPHCHLFGNLNLQSMQLCRQAYSRSSYILQYHTQVWDKGRYNVLSKVGEAGTAL